jgi:AraC-like DNA-binding protein
MTTEGKGIVRLKTSAAKPDGGVGIMAAESAVAGRPGSFQSFIRMPVVQDYLQALHRATGVQVRLEPGRTTSTNRAPLRRHRDLRGGVGQLLAADGSAAALEQETTALMPPRTITVPVRIGDQQIATLLVDPVSDEPAAGAEGLREPSHPVEELPTINRLSRLPQSQCDGIRQLLEIFAEHLANSYHRQLLSSPTTELACVTKAREFILAHYHEPLRVSHIARHVNLCADHCARLFRQETGLSVTSYITWIRIEKTKELLANPQARITEIAFATGFQSLATFNRKFHCLTGQSPRAWRREHVAGASTVSKTSVFKE